MKDKSCWNIKSTDNYTHREGELREREREGEGGGVRHSKEVTGKLKMKEKSYWNIESKDSYKNRKGELREGNGWEGGRGRERDGE